MKLKTNLKKIISAFILIVVICSIYTGVSNSVYGRTNTVYETSGEVGSIDVDQAVEDAPILDAIAHMIYAVAGFIEEIIGSLVKIFTGSKIFPWADRVIFNTIPFLDINFLAPEPGSMFADLYGTTTGLGKIVRNIYYTIFALSITFFGVVVGVMALKLAISSIAAEKAKYKQAITNWLLALILLFTAHYLMSFIFFINEKMVEVASSVIESQNVSFDLGNVEDMTRDEKNDFVKAIMKSGGGTWSNIDEDVEEFSTFESPWSLIFFDDSNIEFSELATVSSTLKLLPNGKVFSVFWYYNDDKKDITEWRIKLFDNKNDWEDNADNSVGTEDPWHERWITLICELMSKTSYTSTVDLKDDEEVQAVAYDAAYILLLESFYPEVLKDEDSFKTGIKNIKNHRNCYVTGDVYDFGDAEDDKEHFNALWAFVQQKYNTGASGEYRQEVFTGMADFFKNAVTAVSTYEDKKGDLKVDNFNPIPAILYSIFVIQSVMYFIAYLKRFFYILVLALFAPLVIIYDFLTKTTMG